MVKLEFVWENSDLHQFYKAVKCTKDKKSYDGVFVIAINGSLLRVGFILCNSTGNESRAITLYDTKDKALASGNPLCSFQGHAKYNRYTLKCTVDFPIIIDSPKTNVLFNYVEYCKKDPELRMAFNCGNEQIGTVIPIMCGLSPVLRAAIMGSNFLENNSKVYPLVNFPAATIQKMVEFCETSHIREYKNYEADLCRIADYLDIGPLKEFAAIALTDQLTTANVLQTFTVSQKYNNHSLTDNCLRLCGENVSELFTRADVTDIEGDVIKMFWKEMSNRRPHISDRENITLSGSKAEYDTKYSHQVELLASHAEYCKKNQDLLMTFKCEDAEVQAAIPIMCSVSPVIETMISESKTVPVVNFSKEVIEKMIEFCETNGIKEVERFEIDLCKLAEHFNIEPLKKYSAILLSQQIGENMLQLYELSKTCNNKHLAQITVSRGFKNLNSLFQRVETDNVDGDVIKKFWIEMKNRSQSNHEGVTSLKPENEDNLLAKYVQYCKKNQELLMTFNCGDVLVEAVIPIMCSVSPVIEAMMEPNGIAHGTRTIPVVDLSADVTQKMVEYCETGGIQESENFEKDLCKIADYFKIQPLKDMAATLLFKQVTHENLLQMMQLAHTYKNEELGKKCVNFGHINQMALFKSADTTGVEANVIKLFWNQLKQLAQPEIAQPVDTDLLNTSDSSDAGEDDSGFLDVGDLSISCVEYKNIDPRLRMVFKCKNDEDAEAAIPFLCRVSPVIEDMLKPDGLAHETNTIPIEGFPAKIVQKMVEFCETGKVENSKNHEKGLYEIAELFGIQALKEYAENLLDAQLTTINVLEIFQLSQSFDNERLAQSCLRVAHQNMDDLFKNADIADVDGLALTSFWDRLKIYAPPQ